MLIALPSNNHLNWKKLNSAAGGVISINGLNGVVSMSSDDLPEGTVNKYFTGNRVTNEVKEFIRAGTNVTVSYNPATNKLTISATDAYSKKEIDAKLADSNLTRADKYLSSQNIANMVYTNGDLTKIQYKNATDVDYEVFSYSGGDLSGIAHYVGGILKGNSVLLYTDGDLSSVVFTEV